MDFIAQYASEIFGLLLVIIVLATLGIVFYAASENTTRNDHIQTTTTQNLNVSGHIRHSHKDINSY